MFAGLDEPPFPGLGEEEGDDFDPVTGLETDPVTARCCMDPEAAASVKSPALDRMLDSLPVFLRSPAFAPRRASICPLWICCSRVYCS